MNDTTQAQPAPAPTQAQPAKPEPTKFQVLAITTAYEQGVGKGQQSRDVKNPYAESYCAEAWQLGYAQGQENTATLPAIGPAQNSEGGLFKREPLFATPQPAKPLTDKQVEDLINSKHFLLKYARTASDEVCLNWYRLGVRDCEIAHGIPLKETP